MSILKLLNENNIIHNDIKPENFLIDDGLNIKLIDYGFMDNRIMIAMGTYEFRSPLKEILNIF